MRLFHYDSKLMQILMFLGDLMILNIVYIICCLPIFTIGAAQAGLYTAVRVLNNPEDDSAPLAAFFKGFRTGFGKVTVGWGLLALLCVIMGFTWVMCLRIQYADLGMAPTWMAIVGFCIAALFQPLATMFHSRFDCTALQLIRNSWFLLVAHPLRSIAVGVMFWLPVILIVLELMDLFMLAATALVWLMLYYAIVALFSDLLMRKPFKTLIDHFNETHGIDQEEETEQEEMTAE